MKRRTLLYAALLLTTPVASWSRGLLAPEPGTIDVEDLLPRALNLRIKTETGIYATSGLERNVGMMAAGTVVKLVGLAERSYRVRGRARHGDVSGWITAEALHMEDPELPNKLRAVYERQTLVDQLISTHEVGLGMTLEEVQRAKGRPSRKGSRVTAAGRADSWEYAVFERVPQVRTGYDYTGQLVQSIIYIKVEVGTLSINFKNGLVDAIEEVKGHPLRGGQIKIVPGPIFMR